jgi:Na+-transporting NADH:ubiquinone oxidoreductase subunit NqrF
MTDAKKNTKITNHTNSTFNKKKREKFEKLCCKNVVKHVKKIEVSRLLLNSANISCIFLKESFDIRQKQFNVG